MRVNTEWVSRRKLAVGVLVLVFVFGLAALVDRFATPAMQGPPLSMHSSLPSGARALFLWLADLGYRTTSLEYRPFEVDQKARVLFVLSPMSGISDAQAGDVVRWVEQGGTLVVVAVRDNPLLAKLGVKVSAGDASLSQVVPLQPVFQNPSLQEIEVVRAASFSFSRPEWVPLLGSTTPGRDVIAAVAQFGSGRAFVLASEYPLSNEGLGKADNWVLARYFVAGVPPGSSVLFDEYHHGLTESGTLARMLFREPWGWAILYSAALLFVYVVLSGRRFGPAIASVDTHVRRSRSEYAATLGALLRQGKHRGWICQQFAGQVKRSLGSRYRVRPDLSAEEFVAVLAKTRPDARDLAEPLRRLEQGAAGDDGTVVALMREVEAVRTRLLGRAM